MAKCSRLFKRWMRETDEDSWTGTSRFMACVMVNKDNLCRY
jgi:hypothetical protein